MSNNFATFKSQHHNLSPTKLQLEYSRSRTPDIITKLVYYERCSLEEYKISHHINFEAWKIFINKLDNVIDNYLKVPVKSNNKKRVETYEDWLLSHINSYRRQQRLDNALLNAFSYYNYVNQHNQTITGLNSTYPRAHINDELYIQTVGNYITAGLIWTANFNTEDIHIELAFLI